MIKDDIITIRFRPEAKRRYRYIYEFWRKGKITRSMCDRNLGCISDHIFGVWGKNFSSKDVYWHLSAFISNIYDKACHHSYYAHLDGKKHGYHTQQFIVWSIVYDICVDMVAQQKILGYAEDDLYYVFRIYGELSKLHEDSMTRYYTESGEVNSEEMSRRDAIFRAMCETTWIRINDYEIAEKFKKMTDKEWKQKDLPLSSFIQ